MQLIIIVYRIHIDTQAREPTNFIVVKKQSKKENKTKTTIRYTAEYSTVRTTVGASR